MDGFHGFQRILFLSLPQHSDFYFSELPVGLGYLEEVCEAKGLDVDVLDMNLGYRPRDLLERLKSFQPDCIAAQTFSVGYKEGYDLFSAVKSAFPRAAIIVGGAHPSVFKEKVLEDCSAVDFAVCGEAEQSFPMLCSGASPEGVPGLVYRREGKVLSNPQGGYIQELDAVPFPRYRKFELEKFTRHTMSKVPKISLCSSRGCPYQCTYCASGSIMGKRYRYRSIGNVLDEIEYWYGRGVRAFSFVDDGFTFQARRVFEFCDGLEKRRLTGCALSCDNGIRADQVSREMLARMREMGFWRVGVGVEAGNAKVLKRLKKGEKIEKIREAVRLLCELRYNVMLYFLVGSPGETPADLEDSFRLALEFPVDAVSFNNIVPYPHTELFDYLDGNGLLRKRPEEYLQLDPRHRNEPIFETPEIPWAMRKQVLKRAFAAEREAARRSMLRKLARLGPLGRVFSYFYGFPAVRSRVMSNTVFRRVVLEPVKKKVGSIA